MKKIMFPIQLKTISDLRKYVMFLNEFYFRGVIEMSGDKYDAYDILEIFSNLTSHELMLYVNIYVYDELENMQQYLCDAGLLLRKNKHDL